MGSLNEGKVKGGKNSIPKTVRPNPPKSQGVKTVYDDIRQYELLKLALYLHSWQGEDYSIEEIIELLNTSLLEFKSE